MPIRFLKSVKDQDCLFDDLDMTCYINEADENGNDVDKKQMIDLNRHLTCDRCQKCIDAFDSNFRILQIFEDVKRKSAKRLQEVGLEKYLAEMHPEARAIIRMEMSEEEIVRHFQKFVEKYGDTNKNAT